MSNETAWIQYKLKVGNLIFLAFVISIISGTVLPIIGYSVSGSSLANSVFLMTCAGLTGVLFIFLVVVLLMYASKHNISINLDEKKIRMGKTETPLEYVSEVFVNVNGGSQTILELRVGKKRGWITISLPIYNPMKYSQISALRKAISETSLPEALRIRRTSGVGKTSVSQSLGKNEITTIIDATIITRYREPVPKTLRIPGEVRFKARMRPLVPKKSSPQPAAPISPPAGVPKIPTVAVLPEAPEDVLPANQRLTKRSDLI